MFGTDRPRSVEGTKPLYSLLSSANGQAARFSTWKSEFDSPWEYVFGVAPELGVTESSSSEEDKVCMR